MTATGMGVSSFLKTKFAVFVLCSVILLARGPKSQVAIGMISLEVLC